MASFIIPVLFGVLGLLQLGVGDHHEQVVLVPLPPDFIDPPGNNEVGGGGEFVPVHRDKVIVFLLGNLKGAAGEEHCDGIHAINNLQSVALEKLKSPRKVERLVRAVANATCDQVQGLPLSSLVNKLAAEISESPANHADRLRRAAEDAAVTGGFNKDNGAHLFGPPPHFFGQQGFPPGGGNSAVPFRFGMGGPNPFFTVPMTAPALEMDLDRLMFLATPTVGISKAFELTKALHLLHSPRSEVFTLQEKFQRNMTQTEAQELITTYEEKLKSSGTSTPNSILQNTAKLSGLNNTEATRFSRAITETLGPLNATQALQIHHAVRDAALNGSQLTAVTNEIEKLKQGETVTPDGATGSDWIFSEGKKRSLVGSIPVSKMFSSTRACGFTVRTNVGVVYPWMTTISCNSLLCTGALISEDMVITTAECILACGTEPVKVLLGDARVTPPVEIFAQSAIVHPRYTQDNPAFDVALVKLSSPLDLNSNPLINPICLLFTETNDPDIQCEAVMGNGEGRVPTDKWISRSPVQCYQPDNNVCSSNGILRSKACVSLHTCIPIQTQKSSLISCFRKSRPDRHFLWALNIPDHSPQKCFNGVARVSDSTAFIQTAFSV